MIRVALTTWVCVFVGCSASLDAGFDRRPCSPEGRCIEGYVCSAGRICVRPTELRSRGDASRDDAYRIAAGSSGSLRRPAARAASGSGGAVAVSAAGAGGPSMREGDAGTPSASSGAAGMSSAPSGEAGMPDAPATADAGAGAAGVAGMSPTAGASGGASDDDMPAAGSGGTGSLGGVYRDALEWWLAAFGIDLDDDDD